MSKSLNHPNKPFYNKPKQLPPKEPKEPKELIAIASLIVAIVAIPISLTIPEIRCLIRLQSESCPGSVSSKAEALYQKGSDLLRLERNREALDYFKQAIDIDRNQAKFWNSRGDALKKLGENQQALSSYEQALLLDSTYELARQNREALLLKLSKKSS
ncbi:tetratricopeptide repeat protein [Microcoleus sp. FACHB-SPT15]|uniref:tetratricopeptide repeat protein n=1 Tax=Microcoleus sp. FACHB-SPT15 TaxID=2692830 RepID=UPI00177F3E3E|nr:tetratricopeptide repeat protein [Microcoleus sp. FACHB-SPT15]MBD1808855.1 tetratricopeptide repeat protein [Microcoleus sp. FACHB-SPT15]